MFTGYRMIVFGGLVALLLIFRPRGLLDEGAVHALRRGLRRFAGAGMAGRGGRRHRVRSDARGRWCQPALRRA